MVSRVSVLIPDLCLLFSFIIHFLFTIYGKLKVHQYILFLMATYSTAWHNWPVRQNIRDHRVFS